jgi:hypothetical protein
VNDVAGRTPHPSQMASHLHTMTSSPPASPSPLGASQADTFLDGQRLSFVPYRQLGFE